MPRDKSKTHEKILPVAKAEFLEKGFEQASMRSIASKVGMSVAGLYRHFEDKEALFAALVEPALAAYTEFYQSHKALDYELLEIGDLERMWEIEEDAKLIVELVYPYFDAFKLLLCCAEGTRYASFLHDFVMMEQTETIAFLEAARAKGMPVQQVDEEELHLLLSAYVTALFEVVIHDFPRDKALHYLETAHAFFNPGWRAILGL